MKGASVRRISLLTVIYLVVGIVIANSHNYFEHVDGVKPFLSAILAVVLWPLISLGISLHIR
jgi:hypothetical protein